MCAITPAAKLRCSGSKVKILAFTASVANDFSWQKISAGKEHFCGILTDGSVKCSGSIVTSDVPGSDQKFIDIASGNHISCGVKVDKTLHCWGYTLNSADVIINVPTTGSWETVTMDAGSWPSGAVACAVATDGAAQCWGYASRISTTHPEAATKYVKVRMAGGLDKTGCGLKQDKTIECWGKIDSGLMANLQPYHGRIVDLSVGWSMACAVVDDGTVVCVGQKESKMTQHYSYDKWQPGTSD